MKKTDLIIIGILSVVLLISLAGAGELPQNGTVVYGNSTITKPDAQTMNIVQTTDNSIINWQSYSIGANSKVQYFQPSGSSISLNRVVGQDPSRIYGQLSANGQVWVINPNGLLVGNGAKIEVGSFLGSTLNISDSDFLSGNYKFTQSGSLADIVNRGSIASQDGGYVVLISPTITNEGSMTSTLGKSYLASGSEVTLNFSGNDLIGLTINKEAAEAALGITNSGTISANGGEVLVSAKVASDLLKTVVNSGVIEAKTIQKKSGKIWLLGDMKQNTIEVSGKLDASAPNGGDGGFIETSAAKVKIKDSAVITTYAPYGKSGRWLIDPNDFYIAASGGDMTGAVLSAALAQGSVAIDSNSGAGGTNGDIYVNDNVSWSANNLTLKADRDINVFGVMTASGSSTLSILTNQGGGGGSLRIGAGRIDFPGRSGGGILSINGANYNVINSLAALQNINGALAGTYALGGDIDASAGFTPLGDNTTPFTGAFDGLGHKITGLNINLPTTDYVGVFGVISGNGCVVSNVGAVGSVIGQNYVGGLVGSIQGGTVRTSYSAGSVMGVNSVGGLAGQDYGKIVESFSDANVVATTQSAGGLVGDLSGNIINCYSTGTVYSPNIAGGLVGTYFGTTGNSIDYSYTVSSVIGANIGGLVATGSGPVTSSFWNTDVNSLFTSAVGTGITTSQMRQLSTFVNAGWDIASGNGFGTIWRIYDGASFPLLGIFLPFVSPSPGSSWLLSGLAGDATDMALAEATDQTLEQPDMLDKQAMIIQRHQMRTMLFSEALDELQKNPNAADVPLCQADKSADENLCLRIPESKPKATSTKRRVALLIGNNDYKLPIPSLLTPVNDVGDISGLLRDRYGYEVKELLNATKAQIIRALNKVAEEAGPEDSVLLFYAGHGYLMDAANMGYWIPADGSTKTAANWISNSDIAKLLQAIQAEQVMLVSDSCYSGTLTREQKLRSARSALLKKDRVRLRSVLAFSSGDEEPVVDEGKSGHSIFAWNLIKTLEKVKETALGYEIYSDVSAGVRREYPQTPQYGAVFTAGHMTGGEYIFEMDENKR